MTSPADSAEGSENATITFNANGVSLDVLTAIFATAEETNSNYERDYLPSAYEDWKREVYNQLEDIDEFSIEVKFE